MSRPPDADSERTWNRIVEAARTLLRTTPSNELSVRRIAETADVSMGTLHYYFRTKEKLLEATLDDYYARLSELARALIEDARVAPEPRLFIEDATRQLWRLHWQERPSMHVRAMARARHGSLPKERRARVQRPQVAAASRTLAAIVGIDVVTAMMVVQSLTHLIFRYTICSDEELEELLEGRGIDVVEEHLVRVALALTFPPSRGSTTTTASGLEV